MSGSTIKIKRWGMLAVLFVGQGVIYNLPYLSLYFYLPLKNALGGATDSQIGQLASIYGLTTICCYFVGGWLADHFSCRKLLTISFVCSGLVGLYMSTFPDFKIMLFIQALFGIFTSATYWAALIKATRQLGENNDQGKFFGSLEGGRNFIGGLVIMASSAAFASVINSGEPVGLRNVVIIWSIIDILCGVLTWFVFKDTARETEKERVKLSDVIKVFMIPVLWVMAFVILGAYVSSVGLMYVAPYATEVYGMSVIFGSYLTVITIWVSPFFSLFAGFVSDKIGIPKTIIYAFAFLIITLLIFAVVPGNPCLFILLLVNAVIMGFAVYTLRGLYWAMMGDVGVPLELSGIAIGIMSTLAFTPDIFMPLLGGQFLDTYGPAVGYKCIFAFMGASGVVGLIATILFKKHVDRKKLVQVSSESVSN